MACHIKAPFIFAQRLWVIDQMQKIRQIAGIGDFFNISGDFRAALNIMEFLDRRLQQGGEPQA